MVPRIVRRAIGAAVRRSRGWHRSALAERAHRSLLRFDPWCLDYARLDGDRVTIAGWALPPGGAHGRVTFALNGRPFEQVAYPRPRPDLGSLYWYLPYAGQTGFACSTPADAGSLTSSGPLLLQCIDRQTGLPFRDEHAYYFNPRSSTELPLPDGPRMRRVHGADLPEAFLLEGYCAYGKLDQALKRYTNRPLTDYPRMLDWGCGCGRLLRHLLALDAGIRIVGCDIDADNVNWCREHLPGAEYVDVPLHPPTPLPSSAFDLIVGISVMTHLRERDQQDWLQELRRIAAPGAILLLTVHGYSTAARGNWDLPALAAWQQRGIVDSANQDLDGCIPEAGYYRNTLQTPDYVRREWERYFEVVDVIESYIGNFQDLVVLRARGAR
jgi:SAM-dependent methyltransferase